MIIDCIMYSYEPDALELRLAELADVVDLTLIVEGDRTFRGQKRKPVRPDAPKTVSKVVTLPAGEEVDPWVREKLQRDATVNLARELATSPIDFVIIADADEIPHPAAVAEAKAATTLVVDYREWYADWRAPDAWQPFNQPLFVPIDLVKSAYDLRNARPFPPSTYRGWHLSTLGDEHFAHQKISEFSHSEYDLQKWKDKELLKARRDSMTDLLERFTLEYTDDLPSTIKKFPKLLGGNKQLDKSVIAGEERI